MSGDKASTHTLEAFIIVAIMFGAVASVANFRVSRSSTDRIDDILEQRARDQLAILDGWPLDAPEACAGKTRLDRLIYDGLNDRHHEWDQIRTTRLPLGADSDMVLSNGHAHYPLHGTGLVRGATASILWAPDLDYAAPIVGTNAASGLEKVTIDTPANHWGSLTRIDAEAVRATITFETATSMSSTHLWMPTALLGDELAPLQRWTTVQWLPLEGDSRLVAEVTPSMVLNGEKMLFSGRIDLRGDSPPSGNTIPAGTTLTITFPRDWSNASWFDPPSGWVDESPPAGVGVPTLRLRVVEDLVSFSPAIEANAPTNPTRPFDIITAKLGGGSLGESNLVVTYPASTERGLPRLLAPTFQYPLRADMRGVLFGAAFANGGDPVNVTSFDLEIPGGYDLEHNAGQGAPLFAGVDNRSSYPEDSKWTTLGPRHIRWEGNVRVDTAKAAQFIASVNVTPDASFATAIEPVWSSGPNATITFPNGYNVTTSSWGKSPGILRARVAPATRAEDDPLGGTVDGYPWNVTGAALGASRQVNVTTHSVLAHLSNTTSYRLSPASADAVAIESALGNASFEVEARAVPVGTDVRVLGDIESFTELIHGSGGTGTMRIDLYAPPSLFCEPTRSWSYSTLDLPRSAVTATLLWDGGTGIPSFFAATEDGNLHRIALTGHTIWSKPVSAGPSLLRKLDLGVAGQYVLVGTTSGRVHALRASDGAPHGTSATLDAAKLLPITALSADVPSGRIYAANAQGTLKAFGTDLAPLLATNLNASVTDIIPDPAGILVHTADRIAKLNGSLHEQANVSTNGPGFARGTNALLMANLTAVWRIDPVSFEPTPIMPLPGDARSAFRGDATGDGVEDLILGLAGQRIRVVSGATLDLAYQDILLDDPLLPTAHPQALTNALEGAAGDRYVKSVCVPASTPAGYAAPAYCQLSDSPGLVRAVADRGALVVQEITNGLETVRRFGSNGGVSEANWYFTGTGASPRALDVGAILTNAKAVLIGDSLGNAVLYDDAQTKLTQSTPSSRSGKFVFTTHVPEGGFYGTHLLVARLSWGSGSSTQEARLVEWFEAVAVDGRPVHRAAYRATLSLNDAWLQEP